MVMSCFSLCTQDVYQNWCFYSFPLCLQLGAAAQAITYTVVQKSTADDPPSPRCGLWPTTAVRARLRRKRLTKSITTEASLACEHVWHNSLHFKAHRHHLLLPSHAVTPSTSLPLILPCAGAFTPAMVFTTQKSRRSSVASNPYGESAMLCSASILLPTHAFFY